MARALDSSTSAQIRAAGVKVTRQRVRVLETLHEARQPLAHTELELLLANGAEAAVERVTLYRILDSLVGCGLALKAVDARGVFRFSSSAARQHHASHVHFRCMDCGGVFCLDAKPPRPPQLPGGFQLRAIDFDLRGTCPQCSSHVA